MHPSPAQATVTLRLIDYHSHRFRTFTQVFDIPFDVYSQWWYRSALLFPIVRPGLSLGLTLTLA